MRTLLIVASLVLLSTSMLASAAVNSGVTLNMECDDTDLLNFNSLSTENENALAASTSRYLAKRCARTFIGDFYETPSDYLFSQTLEGVNQLEFGIMASDKVARKVNRCINRILNRGKTLQFDSCSITASAFYEAPCAETYTWAITVSVELAKEKKRLDTKTSTKLARPMVNLANQMIKTCGLTACQLGGLLGEDVITVNSATEFAFDVDIDDEVAITTCLEENAFKVNRWFTETVVAP
eukprot:m.241530 g.241530  ORF g.241530 m.241530 type:complete len:239 (+) comp22770_c0_seq1:338-1054(+)